MTKATPPAKSRRIGSEQAAARPVILDAAEKVILDEGYASVTTRRVAERAGLKAPLVHYYYKTTDDLLLAVYRRAAETSLQSHAEAMSSDDPLAALWAININTGNTALAIEFMAMANHRKFIGEEISRYAEQIRAIQEIALKRYFRKAGIDPSPFTPLALSVILAGVARALVMESGVGIELGHDETRETVLRLLDSIIGAHRA